VKEIEGLEEDKVAKEEWRRYVDLPKSKKDWKGHAGRSGKLLCSLMKGLKDIVGPTVWLVQ